MHIGNLITINNSKFMRELERLTKDNKIFIDF